MKMYFMVHHHMLCFLFLIFQSCPSLLLSPSICSISLCYEEKLAVGILSLTVASKNVEVSCIIFSPLLVCSSFLSYTAPLPGYVKAKKRKIPKNY